MGNGGLFLRKLRARVSEEPTGFVWVESGKLAGSGYPASRAQVEWLKGRGLTSILSLTEKPLPETWVHGLGLEVKHLPLRDHAPPGPDALDVAAAYIQGQVSAGKPTLVHCLAGEGRTGCVLAAYLIRSRGMSGAEALAALRRIKPQFVEWEQERSVLEYGNRRPSP